MGANMHGVPVIEPFVLGGFATNCYLVREPGPGGSGPGGERFWVVDCGFDPDELLGRASALREAGAEGPEAVVLTHCHVDHIAGLVAFRSVFPGAPIWVHEAERGWLTDGELNLSALMGPAVTGPPADAALTDGQEVELAGRGWRVLHTPGHSPGGISLHPVAWDESAMGCGMPVLVGDALFAGSIGRHDFPGSSFEVLAASIRDKLYALPDDAVVYPGHGPTTTIGAEKRGNPFVRAE